MNQKELTAYKRILRVKQLITDCSDDPILASMLASLQPQLTIELWDAAGEIDVDYNFPRAVITRRELSISTKILLSALYSQRAYMSERELCNAVDTTPTRLSGCVGGFTKRTLATEGSEDYSEPLITRVNIDGDIHYAMSESLRDALGDLRASDSAYSWLGA